MQGRSPGVRIAPNFTVRRWRGYDTAQVDSYLKRLSEHVGRMEARLSELQATEQAALDVLSQAQRVAAETVAEAERRAETLRQQAEIGLANAKKDAFATLDAARIEADKTLLSAREQADAAIEHSRSQVSRLEAVGAARAQEFEHIAEEVRGSASQAAAELRSAGQRLVEMAEHFERELAAGGAEADAPRQEVIDFGDAAVSIT